MVAVFPNGVLAAGPRVEPGDSIAAQGASTEARMSASLADAHVPGWTPTERSVFASQFTGESEPGKRLEHLEREVSNTNPEVVCQSRSICHNNVPSEKRTSIGIVTPSTAASLADFRLDGDALQRRLTNRRRGDRYGTEYSSRRPVSLVLTWFMAIHSWKVWHNEIERLERWAEAARYMSLDHLPKSDSDQMIALLESTCDDMDRSATIWRDVGIDSTLMFRQVFEKFERANESLSATLEAWQMSRNDEFVDSVKKCITEVEDEIKNLGTGATE